MYFCISSGDLPVRPPARGPTAEGADGVCEYEGEYQLPKIRNGIVIVDVHEYRFQLWCQE